MVQAIFSQDLHCFSMVGQVFFCHVMPNPVSDPRSTSEVGAMAQGGPQSLMIRPTYIAADGKVHEKKKEKRAQRGFLPPETAQKIDFLQKS